MFEREGVRPYEVFPVRPDKFSVLQKNDAGVTIWVSGLIFFNRNQADKHAHDLNYLQDINHKIGAP